MGAGRLLGCQSHLIWWIMENGCVHPLQDTRCERLWYSGRDSSPVTGWMNWTEVRIRPNFHKNLFACNLVSAWLVAPKGLLLQSRAPKTPHRVREFLPVRGQVPCTSKTIPEAPTPRWSAEIHRKTTFDAASPKSSSLLGKSLQFGALIALGVIGFEREKLKIVARPTRPVRRAAAPMFPSDARVRGGSTPRRSGCCSSGAGRCPCGSARRFEDESHAAGVA